MLIAKDTHAAKSVYTLWSGIYGGISFLFTDFVSYSNHLPQHCRALNSLICADVLLVHTYGNAAVRV